MIAIVVLTIVIGCTQAGPLPDNECQSHPCVHGICHTEKYRTVQWSECQCTPGYKGYNCDDEDFWREVSVPEDGSAHATSTYYPYGPGYTPFGPEKAFRVYLAYDESYEAYYTILHDYWRSEKNPQKPVSLWFQFRKPKCVTKIKFEEQYKLPSGKEYVIFASNASNDCKNQSEQTVLGNGTADLFAAGMEFENKEKFSCYGLRMLDQSAEQYVAVKKLRFGINGLNEKELIQNCWRGNYDYVKEQSEKFGIKDVIDARWGCSCLSKAAWSKGEVCHQGHGGNETLCKDRLELVKFLLANGAEVNEVCERGQYSALSAATMTGDLQVMGILMDAGADVDIREGSRKRTPIFRAGTHQNASDKDQIKLLLEHGATIDARDKNGVTALREAITDNDLNRTLELVKNGASVEIAKHCRVKRKLFRRAMQTTGMQQIIEHGLSLFQKIESPFGNTTGELLDLSKGKANATSVFNNDIKHFGAQFAFERQLFIAERENGWEMNEWKIQNQSYPWISGRRPRPDQPETVWILLPRNVTISAFSFRSRAEIIGTNYEVHKDFGKMMPTELELVGSNDCKTWTTLLEVKAKWSDKADKAQKWRIPIKDRQPFSCIGIRVKANEKKQTAIQGVELWE